MKVLAIDGGGIRGLIPALVLAEIERRTGRRIAEHVRPDRRHVDRRDHRLRADASRTRCRRRRIAELYEQEGPKIFDASLLKTITSVGGCVDERYDDKGLVDALRRHLGDARLAEATTGILLTAYDLAGARQALLLRCATPTTSAMVDAAHASSAAPTYFEPVRIGDRTLVDGGVFAINPAMLRATPRRTASSTCSPRSAPASTRARCPTTRSRTGASWSGRGRSSTWSSTAAPTRSTASSRG